MSRTHVGFFRQIVSGKEVSGIISQMLDQLRKNSRVLSHAA